MNDSPWPTIDDLIFTRHLQIPAERYQHFARADRGDIKAVVRGAFMLSLRWNDLRPEQQHLARMIALNELSTRSLVFSHQSAVALWRLPWVGSWPERVHVLQPRAGGGRSNVHLQTHCIGVPSDIAELQGMRVTSPAQTVADIAATASFEQAVVVADAALHAAARPGSRHPRIYVDRQTLATAIAARAPNKGLTRARQVLEFARGEADSPGESLSRATMHRARITAPELQVELFGASGKRYVVDFWWPQFSVFGEFDGRVKFEDAALLGNRTPSQVAIAEKIREDDLRAMGRGCARWDWETARSVPALRARLAAAGVR